MGSAGYSAFTNPIRINMQASKPKAPPELEVALITSKKLGTTTSDLQIQFRCTEDGGSPLTRFTLGGISSALAQPCGSVAGSTYCDLVTKSTWDFLCQNECVAMDTESCDKITEESKCLSLPTQDCEWSELVNECVAKQAYSCSQSPEEVCNMTSCIALDERDCR